MKEVDMLNYFITVYYLRDLGVSIDCLYQLTMKDLFDSSVVSHDFH